MKVYELIAELMLLPAGLDVAAQAYKTVNEVQKGLEVDEHENGEIVYSIGDTINEIDSDKNGVYLYF